MYIHTYTRTRIHKQNTIKDMRGYTDIQIFCVHAHIYIHIYIYICMCIYINIYIQIYIYIYASPPPETHILYDFHHQKHCFVLFL